MKKAKIAIVIVLIAAFTILPVLAKDGAIGKFTPTVDGTKDAAYNQSVKINIYTDQGLNTGDGNVYVSGGEATNNGNADAWLLYDDTNIYVFVSVTDPDMIDVGDQFFKDNINGWQSDSCELWFAFTDDTTTWLKFSADGFGHAMWGSFFNAGTGTDRGNADLVPLGYKAVAVKTAAGYDIEYQLPVSDLKNYGYTGGNTPIRFTFQHNNIRTDGTEVVSGLQLQGGSFDAASKLTLGAAIAPPTTEAPPATDAPTAAPAAAPAAQAPAAAEVTPVPAAATATPAPQTGDSGIIIFAVLVLAVSASVLVLRTKKSKV